MRRICAPYLAPEVRPLVRFQQTVEVIRVELALELKRSGLSWSPAAGDRFVVPDRDMDDEVFVVSEMAIEARAMPGGEVLAFNGTTEWALDSLERDEVLWLPREEQLRAVLGGRFHVLALDERGWTVEVTSLDGDRRSFTDPDAESAYALAVLSSDR